MKQDKDAYGQGVWAYYKGGDIHEIVERDDGFINISGGPKSYFTEYKDWPTHEKEAVRFVGGRVLDVGCGAGRFCLHLQKSGFDVTGIDNSPLAVKVCRARGVKKAKIMPIEDIGGFKAGSFDTLIMMGNNFGLFGSFDKAKVLLKKMHRITTPNARIIAESNDYSKTDEKEHLEYQRMNRGRGRAPGQLRLRIRFKKCVSDWFDYLIATKKEMKEVFGGSGWEVKRFIDSNDSRYIAVIEKI